VENSFWTGGKGSTSKLSYLRQFGLYWIDEKMSTPATEKSPGLIIISVYS